MTDLQNLEQTAYSAVQDYFKLLGRKGWVSNTSINRILVLLFTLQFWWRFSVLMEDKEEQAIQRVLNCLGVDCLIPSISAITKDKVVINKRYFGDVVDLLIGEHDEYLNTEINKNFLKAEKL